MPHSSSSAPPRFADPAGPITIQMVSNIAYNLRSLLSEAKARRGGDDNNINGQLDRLCRELDSIRSAFLKLKGFESDLCEPMETLESNVKDILRDLQSNPRISSSSSKQVLHNIDVLRSNLTKLKTQIPLQHHSSNANSEASRVFKRTIAAIPADDLPSLLQKQELFQQGNYFQEIQRKFESLDRRSKLCLLSFSIFPENASVRKRLLMYWWLGEDFVSDGKTAAEFTNEILADFLNKGLIETVGDKRRFEAKGYRIQPITRSVLILLAMRNKFFHFDSEGNPTMNFEECDRACLVRTRDRTVPPANTRDFFKVSPEKVETLFNVSKQFLDFKEDWFSKMKRIMVLYLGKWESTAERHIEVKSVDFMDDLKKSKQLRLLSLQGVSGIRKLPNCICELSKLKILDLRACHDLEKLPENLGLLKSLVHLDISECYLLDKMPKPLSSLSSLQVFKGFVIGDDRCSCNLNDLAKLGELRKLSIYINSKNFDVEECVVVLSSFKKLRKLKLEWGGRSWQDKVKDATKVLVQRSGETQPRVEDCSYRCGENKRTPDRRPDGGNEGSQSVKFIRNKEKIGKPLEAGNVEMQPRAEDYSVGGVDSKMTPDRRGDGGNKEIRIRKIMSSKEKKGKVVELGMLEKLDLQCVPQRKAPSWLVPKKLTGLKKLYIRGGNLSYLNKVEDDDGNGNWEVEILRLKCLIDLKMNWKELREMFPNLQHLERVKCPKVTLCPCDGFGVWLRS